RPAPHGRGREAHPTRCGPVRAGRRRGCGTSGGRPRRGPRHSLPVSWLVTGGAGFVGVNLVRLLATRGIRARVFDDLTHGRREDLAGLDAELVVGDIRDAAAVDRALARVELVVHL